jgi:glycosyltransferase involved in cell wall biosynthesis
MKILIVSFSDLDGGAAKAAYRQHKALIRAGHDSIMLVQKKLSDDPTVLGPEGKFGKLKGILRPEIDKYIINRYKHRSQTLFSPGWLPFSKMTQKIKVINPDIIHLHWVANAFFPIKDFARLNKSVVWTMHDMWAFTGGCHYDENCGKYTTCCGNCPVLQTNKENDISRNYLRKKKHAYAEIRSLTVVGLSKWIQQAAKASYIFKHRHVVNIPNSFNTDILRPIDKRIARQLLQLPQEKKLVVFGAMNATSDPRKGFKELTKALHKLNTYNTELVVFGSSKPTSPPDFTFPTHYLGKLHDELSMQLLYSAADVVVVPSIQENLSNVIIESLACGTPVVGFDIGGNSDMIDHKHNGYLAQPFDTDDLANGIFWAIEHMLYNQISINARQKAVSTYDEKVVIPQYVALYEDILKRSKL